MSFLVVGFRDIAYDGFVCLLTRLLTYRRVYVYVGATNGGSIVTAADDLIQPAANWLLNQRSKQSASWGADTPRALLALLRVTADRSASSATVWDANSLQGLILRQDFDIQLLLFLLKFLSSI